MYPYIAQNLATARGKALRAEAAQARRASLARRARRHGESIPAEPVRLRRPGAPRWA